jgi:hypothetical protein
MKGHDDELSTMRRRKTSLTVAYQLDAEFHSRVTNRILGGKG